MQWLRLEADILSDDKITIIRNMPDGDALFVLWIGLLCAAMKKETDSLYVTDGVPYTADLLAKQLHIEKSTIELGLDRFSRLNMIEICDTIRILNFDKYQKDWSSNKRTKELSAARSAKYREKKKIEAPKKKPVEKIEFAHKVKLKQNEYDTLMVKYGEANAKKAIQTLSNYKLSNGKTYKSDYGAILSWVVEKLKLTERKVTKTLCEHCGEEIKGGLCMNTQCPQYKKED